MDESFRMGVEHLFGDMTRSGWKWTNVLTLVVLLFYSLIHLSYNCIIPCILCLIFFFFLRVLSLCWWTIYINKLKDLAERSFYFNKTNHLKSLMKWIQEGIIYLCLETVDGSYNLSKVNGIDPGNIRTRQAYKMSMERDDVVSEVYFETSLDKSQSMDWLTIESASLSILSYVYGNISYAARCVQKFCWWPLI